MTTLSDAYSFVPDFLMQVCKTLCTDASVSDHETRQQNAPALCKRLAQRHAEINLNQLLMTKDPVSSRFAEDTKVFDHKLVATRIGAAATVGSLEALKSALGSDADQIWIESRVFGYPLSAAAAGNHLIVVCAIVEHFELTQHRQHMERRAREFEDAIGNALSSKYSDVALLLIKIYHEYARPSGRDRLESWLEKATATRNADPIHRVLQLRRGDRLHGDVVYLGFDQACRDNDVDGMLMFSRRALCHFTLSRLGI